MRRNIIWTVTLDLLVGVYELVMEKGGSATLEDVVGVKVGVDKRHNPQPLVKRGSKKKYRKKFSSLIVEVSVSFINHSGVGKLEGTTFPSKSLST